MILVVGSANLDFVVRAPHIPAPGETVLGKNFQTFPGGKGANQAIACARAGGVPTRLLCALGNDAFATPIEVSLREAGVHAHVVRAPCKPTGTAFICVSDEGENAITVAPGANEFLHVQHLPSLEGITHVLFQLETPLDTVTAAARTAKAQGARVILNASPAQSLPQALQSLVDVLVVNAGELDALEKMAQLNIPCLVVTLGSLGSRAHWEGQTYSQPAFPVEVVDTTAAGDTFCGVFVAALGEGRSIPEALRRANAAGALACMQLGAQTSIPTREALEHFLLRHPSPAPSP